MGSSAFDELINNDTESIVSSSPSLSTTDISGLNLGESVSSDKVFSSVSQSGTSSNVFGVYDSKQVVQGLSGDTSSAFSTEQLSSLDASKLQNLSSKSGSGIVSDLELSEAYRNVSTKMTSLKQSAFSNSDGFGSIVNAYTKSGAVVTAKLLGNVNTPSDIASLIPSSVIPSDFEAIKKIFNGKNGLKGFNSCDALAGILGWANSLIDAGTLAKLLKSLFGILGQYDIAGIINCISKATKSISVIERKGLTGILTSSGAARSLSAFTSLGNNGSVVNKYSTVRALGSSSSYSRNSQSGLSGLFSNLGIDNSSSVYQAGYGDTIKNNSIINDVDYPIYDRSLINSTPDNGFSDWCFSGSGDDKLISSVPDSIFA